MAEKKKKPAKKVDDELAKEEVEEIVKEAKSTTSTVPYKTGDPDNMWTFEKPK